MSKLPSFPIRDDADAEITAYHAVSALAVLGLVLGLIAGMVLIEPKFGLVALAGLGVNGLALWRIAAQAPVLVGRRLAVAGLLLSAAFTAAGPAEWLAYRWLVRREARRLRRALVRGGPPAEQGAGIPPDQAGGPAQHARR